MRLSGWNCMRLLHRVSVATTDSPRSRLLRRASLLVLLFHSATRTGGNGAQYFELGVRRVGIKLGEVVVIPEVANLFVRIGFGNTAQSIFFHRPLRSLALGKLRSKTIAVDAVLLYFVSEYSFGRIEQLRGALAVAAGRLERVLNEIAFIGANRSFERKPRDGAGRFGSLQCRW